MVTGQLWRQVLSDGEERLQGPSLPQLDARLLCQSLLLPALQKPWALALPPVRDPLFLHCYNKYRSRSTLLTFLALSSRDIEILALFVSCMCHDLDHRGTNNSFQVASVRAGKIRSSCCVSGGCVASSLLIRKPVATPQINYTQSWP